MIKEQKLFFTRNGEYSAWEMLAHLDDQERYDLLIMCQRKSWITSFPSTVEAYPMFIYSTIDDLEDEDQAYLCNHIKSIFNTKEAPKTDFNAFIYHYHGVSLDLQSAELNLEKLKTGLHHYGINGLSLSIFPHTRINGLNNIIDVRFTSDKDFYYKKNQITRTLHTEIRIYLDMNIAIMTNYSDYTHKENEKAVFVNEVIQRVSDHRGSITPLLLSDESLRNLLTINNRVPTKLKFEVEGRMVVGVDIVQPGNISEIIQLDEVKYFYDRYSLSHIKVTLSEEENKHLLIDGIEGKLMSRASNLESSDIDSFVKDIHNLLKFNYLSTNHDKAIRRLALINLAGPITQKEHYINSCYADVKIKISSLANDTLHVYDKILLNAFFYCMKEPQLYLENELTNSPLDEKLVSYMARISNKSIESIHKTFNQIMCIYEQNRNDLASLMISIDQAITNHRGVT
ncbi:hypothetical protein POF51_07700 [Brevibacillus sp. AG]|uniref:hypothetical protein n=1 Tax=Brevibacillus sp. AG TaxID=3020891 RepID=UPI002330B6FD|nr:hypothetical protein [Brevibacillus sp. AG]MDC0760570.1 hypothetical protein [Brevibacillus sp. AG]